LNRLVRLFFLDFKLLTKNKQFYFKLLLFPTALIFILGTVFGNSNTEITSFDVAFYNADIANGNASLGNVLKNDVLNQSSLKQLIRVSEVSSESEGKKLVQEGKAAAFITVPIGFTNAVFNGQAAQIGLTGNPDETIKNNIVKTVLERFSTNVEMKVLEQKEILKEAGLNSQKLSGDKVREVLKSLNNSAGLSVDILKVPTNEHAVPISARQYYSIAMVVMFSILTSFVLVHGIVDDKLNHTLSRIKSTPIRNIQYVFGKLLGVIFAIVMQMAIVICFTSIFYGMHWGNILYILLITVVYASAIGSIVLLWGILAKDHVTVSSLASPILYIFSFLGGSFISTSSLPQSLKYIQQIIPNGKAINAYLTICQKGSFGDIYVDLLELIAISIVFAVINMIVFNGRWGENANANHGSLPTKVNV